MNFLHSLARLYHPSLTNSDCQGRPRPGVTFPLIFYLLHIDRDHFGVAGTCRPGDCQARCLGSYFRYCDSRLTVHIPNHRLTHIRFSSLGGVESAVAIIVSNMSVIIPAILRTLGVGDPFMQEDTVDLSFNTGVEIVRMTSTRIELGLQTSTGTAITDSSMSRGDTSMMTFQKRDLADSDTKDNQRHQLVTQSSDGSFGNSMLMKVEPLVVGSNIADPLTQVRSLPVAKKTQDIMTDVGGGVRKNSM